MWHFSSSLPLQRLQGGGRGKHSRHLTQLLRRTSQKSRKRKRIHRVGPAANNAYCTVQRHKCQILCFMLMLHKVKDDPNEGALLMAIDTEHLSCCSLGSFCQLTVSPFQITSIFCGLAVGGAQLATEEQESHSGGYVHNLLKLMS